MSISVVASSSKLCISKFYVPLPRTSCPPGYTASLSYLLVPGDALVRGDATPTLFRHSGFRISKRINEVTYSPMKSPNFAPLNDNNQTRVPFNTDAQHSSPDISLVLQSHFLLHPGALSKPLAPTTSPYLLNYPSKATYTSLRKRHT